MRRGLIVLVAPAALVLPASALAKVNVVSITSPAPYSSDHWMDSAREAKVVSTSSRNSCSSRVDPSMSVKRNVTVPIGSLAILDTKTVTLAGTPRQLNRGAGRPRAAGLTRGSGTSYRHCCTGSPAIERTTAGPTAIQNGMRIQRFPAVTS
jgi:hypothetical protein